MTKISILILEDDLVFCRLLQTYLSRHNYSVTITQDDVAAREFIKTRVFDYVLLDYRLPGSNALDLINEMKNVIKQSKLILMSRILDENLIFEAQSLGVQIFLKKPFNPKELITLFQQTSISKVCSS